MPGPNVGPGDTDITKIHTPPRIDFRLEAEIDVHKENGISAPVEVCKKYMGALRWGRLIPVGE